MDLDYFRQLSVDYMDWSGEGDYPHAITLDNIVQSNAKLPVPIVDEHECKYCIIYEIDRELSKHFPIIGYGTENLVFDIGTAVLKRHVSDCRSWEIWLNIMAEKVPGLYSPIYHIPVKDTDHTLFIQEKLTPIDAQDHEGVILKHYPAIASNNWREWEWGLDVKGVPHVFDWS